MAFPGSSSSTSLQQQVDETHRRLDHLLQSGAFNDCTFSQTPRHGVQRFLSTWKKQNENLQTFTSRPSYHDLKQLRNEGTLPYHNEDNISSYTFIPSYSDNRRHALIDHHGTILAYRFQVPSEHIVRLQDSQAMLPQRTILPNVRGNFVHRHYALWADYSPTIMQSREYLTDLPHSHEWLQINKPLFSYLSNTLRMLDPEMYVKFTSIDRYIPEVTGFQRMAGAWHGVAINENMQPDTTRSRTHLDRQDYYRGYNAVVPWGIFNGGNVILWQPKVVYQLSAGECLFFMGGIMAHQIGLISSGTRNSLDLFTHKSTLDWKKREASKRGNLSYN